MPVFLLLLALHAAPPAPSVPLETLLRREVARLALAQVRQMDEQWNPAQRDCAGLVRFVYRGAYRHLRPGRLGTPLWLDGAGRPGDFADAETLLTHSFVPLGRDEAARERLRSGDLLAFRQERDAGPLFHLMLVVRPEDKAHAPARVIYHPGEPGAVVRTGLLPSLLTDAPLEWRPVPQNTAFLGYFRFKEWTR